MGRLIEILHSKITKNRRPVELEDSQQNNRVQLGGNVKDFYPEEWQQETILKALKTGKASFGKKP